ncbi:methyl-accepting chemotaxis protein [Oscillospiraceae bacterium PP1C4]
MFKILKKMKLASKIALIMSMLLIVCFSVFIIVAVESASTAIQDATFGELEAIAKLNATQIQKIVDVAEAASTDISTYLVEASKKEKEAPSGEKAAAETDAKEKAAAPDEKAAAETAAKENIAATDEKAAAETAAKENTAAPDEKADAETAANDQFSDLTYESEIYKGLKISELSKRVEEYMVATAKNTVTHSEDIIAIGVMFEPYVYTPNLESYAPYITCKDTTVNVGMLGDYAEYSKNEYYAAAFQQKQMVLTKPYVYDGITMITAASPVIVNGKVEGVVVADINVQNFDKIDSKNENFPSMYSSIIMDDGTMVYDSQNIANVGQNSSNLFKNQQDFEEVTSLSTTGEPFYYKATSIDGKDYHRFYYPITAGTVKWRSLTAVTEEDISRASRQASILLISSAMLALVVILGVTILTLKKMLNPIKAVVQAAKDLSDGNLDISIESNNQDEIGILSYTFNDTAHSLKMMIREISEILNNIAHNNLNVSTSSEYGGDFIEIKKSIDNIIYNLNSVIGDINQSADQVSGGSEQISSAAQALSQGATEQASSIEELSASIVEIAEHVKKNASNSADASVKAATVGDEVQESNQYMQSLIGAMTEISDSSNQIRKIIKTIEDIAFQTNILALNAAVEAARAGAAGKGFAVVADEVRNLASKSAEAAKSTTALIESSIRAVDNGTQIADTTAKSLNIVVSGVNEVSNIIDQISQASNEQANYISQVTQGVEQISTVVQTNSATAEESAAASEELSSQAQILKIMVNKFKLDTTKIGKDQNDTAEITEVTLEYSANDLTADKY